jgi:hypothetical protein
VYVWIWRRLPGGRPGKLAGTVLLVVVALALLFFVIFPYAEPRLPFGEATVGGAHGSAVSAAHGAVHAGQNG